MLKTHTWKASDTEVERIKGKMMLGGKANLQNYVIKGWAGLQSALFNKRLRSRPRLTVEGFGNGDKIKADFGLNGYA